MICSFFSLEVALLTTDNVITKLQDPLTFI